jgi:hypothetical protein
MAGAGTGDHVDGVAHACLGREERLQGPTNDLAELGDHEAVVLARVGGDDPGAAPVRNDGHPASPEVPLRAQHRGQVEHFLDGPRPYDAGLVEESVDRHVARG